MTARVSHKLSSLLSIFIYLTACAEIKTEKPKEIIVLGDRTYAPYEFIDGNRPAGLMVDLWTELWAKKTGIKVNYVLNDWNLSLEQAKISEVGAISSMIKDSEREKDFDFIRRIMVVEERIYFHKGKYTDLSSWRELV
jgi:polar amino acid transport system substrate-binding protein